MPSSLFKHCSRLFGRVIVSVLNDRGHLPVSHFIKFVSVSGKDFTKTLVFSECALAQYLERF